MVQADVLADFTRFEFDDGRWTREVFRIGSGPAVIVIHEVPGLHPACWPSPATWRRRA